MQNFVRRILTIAACCGFVLAFSGVSFGEYYTHTTLVSNLNGAAHKDVLLKNPWGLAYGPGAPFWISDEASGWSTLYDGKGNPQTAPTSSASLSPSCPSPCTKSPAPACMSTNSSRSRAPPFSPAKASTVFRPPDWPTAGILEHALSGSLLAWSNPSTNSYRRLVPGYGAPVSATFAQGSRAAAVRIPGYLKKGEARIEFRTGDATANVYYFLAAMLLAGLDGIGRKLDPVAKGYNAPKERPRTPSRRPLPRPARTAQRQRLPSLGLPRRAHRWLDRPKEKEAEYVYNAPVPQEYELYF